MQLEVSTQLYIGVHVGNCQADDNKNVAIWPNARCHQLCKWHVAEAGKYHAAEKSKWHAAEKGKWCAAEKGKWHGAEAGKYHTAEKGK